MLFGLKYAKYVTTTINYTSKAKQIKAITMYMGQRDAGGVVKHGFPFLHPMINKELVKHGVLLGVICDSI